MTKRSAVVIGCVLSLMLLLSGCKLPASKAPATETVESMTTPILIQTDSPENQTKTAAAKAADNTTPGADSSTPAQTDTPEPTNTVAIPTLTRPAEYTLQEGEFLYCIARRFDLNPADLLELNDIGEDDLLSPGTVLQIPSTGSWGGDGRVLHAHPTTHTVSSGETVYTIACYYGDVSPEAIIAVNNLAEPYKLSVGQELAIP
jgi:LysM repeat protein